MTTPPYNPFLEDAKPAPTISVRLGADDGSTPTAADELETLRLIEVRRMAGGRNLDSAVLQYDDIGVDSGNLRLVDLETPARFAAQADIRVVSPEDGSTLQPLAWGDLSVTQIRIDRQTEGQFVRARLEPHHFGNVLTGFKVWNPRIDEVEDVHGDPMFNPLDDGIMTPNMFRASVMPGDGWPHNLWIEPDAQRTDTAREFYNIPDGPAEWSLALAVDAICLMLNPDETFIRNPDLSEVLSDAPDLRNIGLKRGSYLPIYLDALLAPHGYSWFVQLSTDDSGTLIRTIKVFKLGAGSEKQLYLQAPGESLDLALSNTQELDVETDLSALANKITAHGSLERIEFTIELYRGWPEADDGKTAAELNRDDPGSDFVGNEAVWRLWPANEGGDYSELRPEIPSTPLSLASYFLDQVLTVKRRPMGDCLTYDPADPVRPLRAVIEFWEPEDEIWKEVPAHWGAVVLPDQCGVYFSGATPPEDLIAFGEDARIRITGTITGDHRVTGVVSRRESSPNARDIELFLDVSDRFHLRTLATATPYASQFVALDDADERDDFAEIADYVARLQEIEESAALSAQFTLHGLVFDYEIGDLITSIDGRNISLNRNSPDSQTRKYLQVMGITWDQQKQTTVLAVDSVDAYAG